MMRDQFVMVVKRDEDGRHSDRGPEMQMRNSNVHIEGQLTPWKPQFATIGVARSMYKWTVV